ncbi:PIN domain-containing protein [Rhodococcus opacus]|uniref:PIN domain-containing protein n=1 Tax=Rhodococcus opacus TaxID=37919 RepID=UPI001B30161D|nr:PIN domain-containing protein [Rhodococcus opacus]
MFVVLDSNILLQDKKLTSAKFESILASSEAGHIQLVVPQVVFDEYINKFRETAPKAYQEFNNSLRSYKAYLPESQQSNFTNDKPDFEELTTIHQKAFTDILFRAKAKILPYPATTHEAITRRALDRRRPFTKEGHVGYRDVLIWESILELAPQGKTFLVTNDGGFVDGADGTPKLHPDLIADLEKSRLNPERVVIYRTTDAFVKDQIESDEGVRARLEVELQRDGYIREDFRDLLDDLLVSEPEISADTSHFDISVGGSITEIRPISAYDLHLVKVIGAKQISEDNYFVTIEAEIDVDVEVDVEYDDRQADELFGGTHIDYTAETITATCDVEARYQDGRIFDAKLTYVG